MLPESLRLAIETVVRDLPSRHVAAAASQLSTGYRAGAASAEAVSSQATRLAYLAVRAPATYAACHRVFRELIARQPSLRANSLLDLGAGPGTALWAASDVFPDLVEASCVEADGAFTALGQRVLIEAAATESDAASVQTAWTVGALPGALRMQRGDVVVASYALGELAPDARRALVERAWAATGAALCVIEAGSQAGFAVVREARALLIELGAYIVAPCPHERACPLAPGDWCHFAERLPRSSTHRRLKGGDRGFEDEKYSYVIATREAAGRAPSRVLHAPKRRGGHVHLTLCAEAGVVQATPSRRDKVTYRRARKLRWGDAWDPVDLPGR